MKYILCRELFESEIWAPLLNLEGNVDQELLSIIESLVPSGKILEISCGNGADAFELKNRGYDITATENNQKYYEYVSQHINCIKHDTRNKFPFSNNSFDLVYSRLGLHYFTKEELSNIFQEISRITNQYLVFTVKIQQDEIKSGKIMISKEEWEELVSNNFNILSLKVKEGILYDDHSKWLEFVAEKL